MPQLKKGSRPIRPSPSAKVDLDPKIGVKPAPVSAQSKRSAFLIMLGLPLLLVSSVILYRRVFEGQGKRVQQGEYTPDGVLRLFTEEEKREVDRKSWLTRIFGIDR